MSYAFISGATGGIGRAFAQQLARENCKLFLTGRSEEKLKNECVALKEINSQAEIKYCACDLTKEEERTRLIDYIKGLGITFNKLVMVAGVDTQKGFLDYTLEKLTFQLRVNVEATVCLTHQLLNFKSQNEKTHLLVISSMSGATPMPYFAVYSATKCMLKNLFTALHYELKGHGVNVTTVMPGGVFTRPDIIEDIKRQGLWGKLSAKTPEFVAKKSLKAVKKNKTVYIPGGFNKFLYFILKIVPSPLVLRFIRARWKKQTKDAF